LAAAAVLTPRKHSSRGDKVIYIAGSGDVDTVLVLELEQQRISANDRADDSTEHHPLRWSPALEERATDTGRASGSA
jgi:hypothetical protein